MTEISSRFLISSGLLLASFWFLLKSDYMEDLDNNIIKTKWKLYTSRLILMVAALIIGLGVGKYFR